MRRSRGYEKQAGSESFFKCLLKKCFLPNILCSVAVVEAIVEVLVKPNNTVVTTV